LHEKRNCGRCTAGAERMVVKKCFCRSCDFTSTVKNGLPVRVCSGCGAMHQEVRMEIDEYRDWYRREYPRVYVHTREHDLEVGEKRIEQHGEYLQEPVLDVGCGNGGFLEAVKREGILIDGCDLRNSRADIYHGAFEELLFPSGGYGSITMHDVIEHCVDPREVLKEAWRVLRDDGMLIVEFPNFFVSEGLHHWKKIEHLWLLSEEQIARLIRSAGFEILETKAPIPGKLTFYARKLGSVMLRRRILVPSGIGDIYWLLCKKVFSNGDLPKLYVVSSSYDRALEFVKRAPFVEAAGYAPPPDKWYEMVTGKRCLYKDVGSDLDFFLSVNGPLTWHGKSLDDIHPEIETDWYYSMFRTLDEIMFEEGAKSAFGEYVVVFFTDSGFHTRWLQEFNVGQIIEMLKLLHKETGFKVILTGGSWDHNLLNQTLYANVREFSEYLVGQTNFDQFFGLFRGAVGCIGYPGGNTIMSVRFRKPTVMLWHHYYPESFWKNACPPDSLGRWYFPMSTRECTPEKVVETFVSSVRNFNALKLV